MLMRNPQQAKQQNTRLKNQARRLSKVDCFMAQILKQLDLSVISGASPGHPTTKLLQEQFPSFSHALPTDRSAGDPYEALFKKSFGSNVDETGSSENNNRYLPSEYSRKRE